MLADSSKLTTLPSCLACLALAATVAAPVRGASSPAREFLFDLGRSNSVVRPGWTQVTEQTVYTKDSGYGWERPAAASFDNPLDVRESFRASIPGTTGGTSRSTSTGADDLA